MPRAAPRPLLDLFAAAEAIGDNEAIGVGRAHPRQEHALAGLMDTSYFSRSNPNEPAMPQQPEGSTS